MSLPPISSRPLSKRPLRRRSAGFSLAEVMLAVGIVSFGMLTMLGIMPVGLNTMREAVDSTVRAQIVQRVAATAALTPYQTLKADLQLGPTDGKTQFYFDREGFEQTSKSDATTRYIVGLSDAGKVSLPASADYSGGVFTDDTQKNMVAVKVSIQRMPGNQAASTHVILVANQGN